MRQPTQLMVQILKNKIAQRIIDYVSPVYGDGYVALWIYEAIGIAFQDVSLLAEGLRYETNPITTDLLMDYWEDHYQLSRDSSLTMEQRRFRLLEKIRYRAPCNPARLAAALEAVLWVPVELTERVAKNTFQVEIQGSVPDLRKLLHAISVLEKRKPAHLIYRIHVTSPGDDTHEKLAAATAQAETYQVGVQAIKLTLQATLEKAIKLGAAVTVGEQYQVNPEPIAIATRTQVESQVREAAPVSAAEEYNIKEIQRTARIAVETAFSMASSVFSSEEYHIEEVTTHD